METVNRAHPAETGDSQADACPTCDGSGKYRNGTQRAGQTCDTCAGSGFLLRQRLDANGNPTRVRLVDAGLSSGAGAEDSASGTAAGANRLSGGTRSSGAAAASRATPGS